MAHRSLKGISAGVRVEAMSIRPAGASAAAMAAQGLRRKVRFTGEQE